MKQFKKRTLALVLASVITVVGSFATENYKNSLMGLDFVNRPNGDVGMILQTKANYTGQINPVRKDSNTYVIMLPEFNSEAPTPDLTKTNGCIESVNIRTMPYSGGGKGYTRVTIKTFGNIGLSATSRMYIPQQKNSDGNYRVNNDSSPQSTYVETESYNQVEGEDYSDSYSTKQDTKNIENQIKTNTEIPSEETVEGNTSSEEASTQPDVEQGNTQQNSHQRYMLILGVILLVTVSVFIYLRAKEKIVDVVGEKLEIDISDEEKEKEKEKEKPKKKPLAPKTTVMSRANAINKTPAMSQVQAIKPIRQVDIVDLDKLFQEQNALAASKEEQQETENSYLEDFLKDFCFDEKENEPIVEAPLYDEETYKTVIHSSIKFTKDDIKCINQLLNSEIYEETINNIEKYAENPITISKPSNKERLENIVTELAVSQNITFTNSDIIALKKLISVEIDSDFINDLRTNPERTKQMAKEIETHDSKPVKSKMGTLHVKGLLPNLSEELSKQGKRIESDGVKPATVYYSEGYEYTKLKVDNLPDLTVEINNKDAYASKPSFKEKIVETGYEYESFVTDGALPDLADVMAHPEKYKEAPKEKAKADEQTMLERIMNVQFKPFDDGSQEFEVLNDFNEEPVPTVDEIQQEFNQFGDFEIADDTQEVSNSTTNPDNYEDAYSEDYIDLDKNLNEISQNKEEEKINQNKKVEHTVKPAQPQKSEELLKRIEASRLERASLSKNKVTQKPKQSNTPNSVQKKEVMKCICEGASYDILDSVALETNLGCHLAKNANGYVVFAYNGDNLSKLKEYPSVNIEKIQARLSEKIANGTPRYIVRIGANKFIVDIKDNNICYVMDLC